MFIVGGTALLCLIVGACLGAVLMAMLAANRIDEEIGRARRLESMLAGMLGCQTIILEKRRLRRR